MSNTKGSMLISNANAVGTELVNQLGGTGYTPAEWADAINLLGISDDDKASALAGITEGTYTGTERGAIKYSNCNAVGSMLNKKFSIDRGFKPVEWESAISKLTPLAEGTVSGAICNIVNGAEDVPVKSWLVTLPASLDGYSEIDLKHSKKNLLLPRNADSSSVTVNGITRSYLLSSQTFTMTGTNTKTDSAWLIFNGSDWIIDGLKKGETYTFYHNLGSSMYSQITYYDTNGALKALVNLAGSAGKNNTRTFTIPSDFDRVRNFQIGVYASATDINEDAVFMLCAGSSATTYEPYEAPTTATASLGRTIYGGTADVVTGEGEDENGNAFTFTPIPTPETPLGVSNWWSDNGDSTITYRKDPDIPDPPVQLLNMNNNNEDNNEGV